MLVSSVLRVVVMGVAGSGKTTVARSLADRLDVAFLDADDAHPPANIAKMSAGVPLDDADRRPWLERLRDELAAQQRMVVTCSALKRSYRDLLRAAGGVRFVFLDVDRHEVLRRVGARADHFMGVGMVDSQFDALERPGTDETDVLTLDATGSASLLTDGVVAWLAGGGTARC